VTASWKPPDSNVRVAASKPREERSGPPPRCRIAGEVDSFRVANDRETKRPSQGLSTQITIAPTNRRQPCTHLGYALRWARIECSGKQNLQAPEAARRRPSGPKNHPRQKTLGMASSRRNPPTTRTVWGLLIQTLCLVWSADVAIRRNQEKHGDTVCKYRSCSHDSNATRRKPHGCQESPGAANIPAASGPSQGVMATHVQDRTRCAGNHFYSLPSSART
jgi:hypothetical protein